jgi:hypothetical protein
LFAGLTLSAVTAGCQKDEAPIAVENVSEDEGNLGNEIDECNRETRAQERELGTKLPDCA